MTPFDPVAFVAMLQTFYPSVTLTSLQRAFRERPDYFAGGHLFGRLSDVLVLPDGRAFDIVFAAWTSASRWQAIYLDPNAPRVDDPFALEPGPLVELDVDASVPPPGDPIFEPFVASHLAALQGAAGVLDNAVQLITEGAAPTTIGDDLAGALADAQWAVSQQRHANDALRLDELIVQTNSEGGRSDVPPIDEATAGEPPPDFDGEDLPAPPPDEPPPPAA